MRVVATCFALGLLPLSGDAHGAAEVSVPELGAQFRNPPTSARPWVYYFVVNGNMSRESITADLEAMAHVGIGGLLLMDVDQDVPKGPAEFGGPQWRNLFSHLCHEAQRLGLEINLNNAAGFSSSGGPWITPELSMQKLVWSESFADGGQEVHAKLPQPAANEGFYRDVAVLAFPTLTGDEAGMLTAGAKFSSSGTQSQPGRFTLPSPSEAKPQFIQIEFPALYEAFEITAKFAVRSIEGTVQVSEDGTAYRQVAEFATKSASVAVRFDLPIKARFYRLVLTKTENSKASAVQVHALDLNPRYRIEDIQSKSLALTETLPLPPAQLPDLPPTRSMARTRILDLSSEMNAAGELTCALPAGRWTLMRFGHTSTGRKTIPAPEGGQGLECDKLSKQAAAVHFQGLAQRLIEENRALAGVGKTLTSLHIDSWEVGSQNWTSLMRQEFQRRRGYDPLPLLPVVTGRVVESLEQSERFLWDLRQTISELLAENYAGELRRLASEAGLRLSIEAYGSTRAGAPANDLDYGSQADEPMAEFWAWPAFAPTLSFSCTEMASVAHTWGKRIVGAEAFTSMNHERWLGHPATLKGLGDWAFCEGINRLVIHRYAAQPWMDVAPGMTMGPWGLHYERTQTWWEYLKPWHDYLARCQHLLRQGHFVADIACLQPEQAPARVHPPESLLAAPFVRGGYNFDLCSPQAVLTRMSVKDGQLVLPDGMSYRALVVPPVERMTPKLLAKLKELSDGGALLVADVKPPRKSPSLADLGEGDAKVKSLADALWPKIATGKPVAEVLAARGLPPDFSATPLLRFTHRQTEDADIYFVANPEAKEVTTQASFRVTGVQPEFWYPDTGRITPVELFEEEASVTRMPIRLESHESVFVVFRKNAPIAKKTSNSANWLSYKQVQEIAGPWNVTFDPRWGGPTQPVTFETLQDWRGRNGCKYYSGTAIYRTQFALSSPAAGKRLFLDLGNVAVMAEVMLNGKPLGTLWRAPHRVEITPDAKAGPNILEIKVVNLWINRLIGDEQLLEDCEYSDKGCIKAWPKWLVENRPRPSGRRTFSTWHLWKKNEPLVPSGLLGPVIIQQAN